MRKYIILTLLFFVSFSYAQKLTKWEKKQIDKMQLKIINRGLDMNSIIVPYYSRNNQYMFKLYSEFTKDAEDMWEEDLFEAGFEVGGSYNDKAVIKDTENREMLLYKEVEFKGRYVFEFESVGRDFLGSLPDNVIKIYDLANNNKLVCTIKFKANLIMSSLPFDKQKRMYILDELKKSN